MNFYYISYLQKMDIFITTLLFCIFISILRPLLINEPLNILTAIIITLLFFLWYSCTILYANAFTYEYQIDKLKNI